MYSNTTTHYSLPQYEANDVPSILGDVNGAYQAIDTAIYNVADAASTAGATATQAATDAGTALTNASAAQADATQALADAASAQSDATQAITTANAASASAGQAITDSATALSTAQTASSTASSAATAAAGASATATQAASDASTALTTAQSASTAASGAQTDATSALTLIGDTPLTTTARTLTGAIEEVKGSIPDTSKAVKLLNIGTISVEHDGVKTVQQVGNEVFASFVALFTGLQSGEYIKMTNGSFSTQYYPTMIPLNSKLIDTAPSDAQFCIPFVESTGVVAGVAAFSASYSHGRYYDGTYHDMDSTVLTTGNAFISYEKYYIEP